MCCSSLCYPRTCCCCISPRNASIILAVLGILSHIGDIIQSATGGSMLNQIVVNSYVLLPEGAQENEQLQNALLTWVGMARYAMITSAIFSVIYLIIDVLLIYGVIKNKHGFMLPWLILYGIYFVISTIVLGIFILVALGVMIYLWTLGEAGFGFLCLFFALLFFGWIMLTWHYLASVRTHYYELKERNDEQVPEKFRMAEV